MGIHQAVESGSLQLEAEVYLKDYMDVDKLRMYEDEGIIDRRGHRTLPLNIYTFSKRAVYENLWDDITTKCRGLIVHHSTEEIIARPFEKFFNIDTDYRPETHRANLPDAQPIVSEKLDGSLGILWRWGGQQGIATKGSFHSEQAEWATKTYNRYYPFSKWPEGYTPVFEIINESIQHHVVHYHGYNDLVLLALIENKTGMELNEHSLQLWARMNGISVSKTYNKSLDAVLAEDRKNHEGYVLSWPRLGRTPLKIKVKHKSFLDLQKVVHAATPGAILEALKTGNVDLLNTWIGQTNEPIGQWVKSWLVRLNGKYGEILIKSNNAYKQALFGANPSESRKAFALYVKEHAPEYASICFAMLDGKDHKTLVWKKVEENFDAELSKPFAIEEAKAA